MKRLFIASLITLAFIGCKKDQPMVTDSEELQQHADWKTEKFKTDYTIQFPDNYSGGYVQGFEGGWFDKNRNDSTAHLLYIFSNGLQTFDFGDTLNDPMKDTLWVSDGDPVFLLDKRIDFTLNETTQGILYYNEAWSIRRGELYWKDGGVFRDALTLHYAGDLQDEMISILKTIQHN